MGNEIVNKTNNTNNSNILDLESLVKSYDTILIQYNQVQTDYINYLQLQTTTSSSSSSHNMNFTNIKGSTFWGTSGLTSTNASSVGQCSALCSRTPGCSGATFSLLGGTNNNQTNCWLRSGDGIVVAGNTNQYAIVTQNKQYLLTLNNLNAQLVEVNGKIMKIIQNNKNIFTEQHDERSIKYNLLKKNYEKLERERLKILDKLTQFQSIDEKQTQTTLNVNKNYYNYVLLLFIVVICIIILSKILINSKTENIESNLSMLGIFALIFFICFLFFLVYNYSHNRSI
jgi:NADH:ubiquinone oxidoreductase subunit 3 (subunit A)